VHVPHHLLSADHRLHFIPVPASRRFPASCPGSPDWTDSSGLYEENHRLSVKVYKKRMGAGKLFHMEKILLAKHFLSIRIF
jgi:hypothetical protein